MLLLKQACFPNHCPTYTLLQTGLFSLKPAASSYRYTGVSRHLPLSRRDFSTSRPPRVAALALKPCVRFLLIFLGWYVRLGTMFNP